MRRLREQIKTSQAFQHVFPPPFPFRLLLSGPRNDLPNVPRLRMDITTYIHDGLCTKGKQLPYERLVAPLARRVNDERGVGGRKVADSAEDLCRVARTEGDFMRKTVERCVVCREADRVCGELDTSDLCEVWSESEREEACAAVGVDKVSRGRGAWRGSGCCGGWENGVADV